MVHHRDHRTLTLLYRQTVKYIEVLAIELTMRSTKTANASTILITIIATRSATSTESMVVMIGKIAKRTKTVLITKDAEATMAISGKTATNQGVVIMLTGAKTTTLAVIKIGTKIGPAIGAEKK